MSTVAEYPHVPSCRFIKFGAFWRRWWFADTPASGAGAAAARDTRLAIAKTPVSFMARGVFEDRGVAVLVLG